MYNSCTTYIIRILNDPILLVQAKVAEHEQLCFGILWRQPAQFTHVIFVHAENIVKVIEVLLRYLTHNMRTLQAMILQRAEGTGICAISHVPRADGGTVHNNVIQLRLGQCVHHNNFGDGRAADVACTT